MTPDIVIGEFFFILVGVIFAITGGLCGKDAALKNRIPAATFWFILAFAFITGPWVPAWLIGICVIVLATITAVWGVKPATVDRPDPAHVEERASKLGYKVFIPALSLAVFALVAATVYQKLEMPTYLAVGTGAVLATVVGLVVTKAPAKFVAVDGARLTMDVGPVGILPQLLAALGAVFTAAGVGTVIADTVAKVIPAHNPLVGVIAYCVGMALFTVIMGNGFAAFSVITVGIGIPFVVAQGGNPIIVAALGLTAGYCGTLLTPMAANFNVVPAVLLEMKDKYGVIKSQAVTATLLLLVHIVLMYTLAF